MSNSQPPGAPALTPEAAAGTGGSPARPATPDRTWVLPSTMVLLAMFAAYIGQLTWYPVMPAMMKAWGVNMTQMGLFLGIMGFMPIVLSVPMGWFSNKAGHKLAIMLTLAVSALGAVIIALAPNLSLGFVGRVIASAGFSLTQVPALAALGLVAPRSVMARMMAILTITAAAALVLGQQLLAARLGTASGWQATFWAMAAVTVVVLVLFALFFNPKRKAAPASAGTAQAAKAAAAAASAAEPSPYKNPQVWSLAFGLKLAVLGGLVSSQIVPLALSKQFGMNAQGLATVASLGSIIGIFFILGAGWLSDKLGTRKWVALAFIAATALFVLGLNTTSLTLFTVCAVAYSAIGSGPVNGVLNAAFPEVHPHRNVASAFGLAATIGGIIAYLVPQLLGILVDRTGTFNAGWLVIFAGTVIAGLLVWRTKVR